MSLFIFTDHELFWGQVKIEAPLGKPTEDLPLDPRRGYLGSTLLACIDRVSVPSPIVIDMLMDTMARDRAHMYLFSA